ncbi:Rha family transcriptional regulator [Vibrio furnissii]|uniref:Rha family transcriptional regulator n=1 Tax=Vibrio furnissii TaxID=29494 RepID=UPI0020C1A757|nr:Rha family transcriptional regulator [Vibrio furnissii]
MNMIKHDQNLTMSSREIAELTGKRHDNVKADVTKMLDELNLDVLNFQGIYFDAQNRKQTEYKLDRYLTLTLVSVTQSEEPTIGGGKPTKIYHVNEEDSYIVVARLSPEFTAKIVKRWRELEEANQL